MLKINKAVIDMIIAHAKREAPLEACGYLAEKDGVVVIQQSGDSKREMAVTGKMRIPKDTKVVVLVNGGSASASEIVAGALRDRGRAKLVGQKTFGKGTIQEARPVDGDSGLHITIAKWLTPNGTWVHEKGLEPDVVVENKTDTEEDEQLTKALELLK